jgi:hypothetical protein
MIRVMVPIVADAPSPDAADRTATHFVQAMVRLLGRHLAV